MYMYMYIRYRPGYVNVHIYIYHTCAFHKCTVCTFGPWQAHYIHGQSSLSMLTRNLGSSSKSVYIGTLGPKVQRWDLQ